MRNDIMTVLQKELLEIWNMRESRKSFLVALIVPVFILGIQFPMIIGAKWVTSYYSTGLWIFVPFIFISAVIADSFAGERERHTLETLLSTRLPEKTILLGKIGAASIYAIIVTLIIAVVSLVTVNIAHPGNGLLIFSPYVMIFGVTGAVLTATTGANIGALVSLRASTVRQAQQSLGIGIMVIVFTPAIVSFLVPKDTTKHFFGNLDKIDPMPVALLAYSAIVVLDILLFLIASWKFKRNKMNLD